MTDSELVFSAFQAFAQAVTDKMKALGSGEPENQLRGPFEALLGELQKTLKHKIVTKGEARVERLGKPDFAVHTKGLPCGYVELKAPGKGARPERYKGHDKRQWTRFKNLPNILYTDGNEWALYRDGKRTGKLVKISGDVTDDGKKAVAQKDALALMHLLKDFLKWEPIIPRGARQLAGLLAPLCRMLRDDVIEALEIPGSALVRQAETWRKMLFPEASDRQFADAYAQTVTFALLLARSEGADALKIREAIDKLANNHALLSRALEVLTDALAKQEVSVSVEMLQRVIAQIPQGKLIPEEDGQSSFYYWENDPAGDPWLYFYEDFLAVYDPELRKDAGAYYTPVEVVRAQVRLIDELLSKKLRMPLGFADPGVITLDPAVGTGTYLLALIQHALSRVVKEQGTGAVSGQAAGMADRIYGFENMVGPYAVAQLRVSRSLMERGVKLPEGGPGIYLTDTLESPHTEPSWAPAFYAPMADQHKKALKIKDQEPVLVCLGNPPYDRHAATNEEEGTGGWVRWGDKKMKEMAGPPILDSFLEPARRAGHGVHLKNLYNLYVYFWCWALWKIFEHRKPAGPGIVSFITASSYLDGDAFVGMREYMRRQCDEIWILDLGGEGRGARREENVFNIQTPVAIALAVRYGEPKPKKPAKVHYARITGTREEKLKALEKVKTFASSKWTLCPEGWQYHFRPKGKGEFFSWPLLTDIFPWQHSGVQFKRTWPIAQDKDILLRRWKELLIAKDKADAFKETRDRKVNIQYPPLAGYGSKGKTVSGLAVSATPPSVEIYGYRSFDRQRVFADNRLGDYLRPSLWLAHGPKQVYFASLLYETLGNGPAITCSAWIPDLHYFSGRGAKDILPLYRDHMVQQPNINPGLIKILEKNFGLAISPEDLAAYIYGILAHSSYTDLFFTELEKKELRVPLTKDRKLFAQVRDLGRKLLWLHTYGERFVPKGEVPGQVPAGAAKCIAAVPDSPEGYPEEFSYNEPTKTLHIGKGSFAPVAPEVFEFEVSGLKVVQSWLKYRRKKGAGKKSSPLDDIRPERWTAEFTTELLNLLWILEATLKEYPRQAKLLEAVVAGETFKEKELPKVPAEARKPPKAPKPGGVSGKLAYRENKNQ